MPMIRNSSKHSRKRPESVATPFVSPPSLDACEGEPRSGWLAGRLARAAIRFRVAILGAAHLAVFCAVYYLAFGLRFDFALPADDVNVFWRSLPWVIAIKLAVFYVAGHYHGWWSYVTFADLLALLKAVAVSVAAIIAIDYFLLPAQIPRSILPIDSVLTIVVFGGLRASSRIFQQHFWARWHGPERRSALLVGADRACGMLAHQINEHPRLEYRICGYLAVGDEPVGMRLSQLRVVGRLQDLRRAAAKLRVEDVLVTTGSLPGRELRQLMETCDKAGLYLKILPPLEELLKGSQQVPVRDIEITDLLRREPVVLDSPAIEKLLAGKTVLVTGAGGSIGSEICRQILRFSPSRLVLLGRGENRIFHIERELRMLLPSAARGNGVAGEGGLERVPTVTARIGDVTDATRLRCIFEEFRPQVIFHAAAHKHVPLMEDNPGEAVKNNVLGTKNVADLAHEFHAEAFVLISTDKAVHPSSVMGATKQLAERYVMALSQGSRTRFVATRFGNVLGSAGSVVPLFQEQIRRGGPITVTDPRMTRYFMSIPEASQLVLQAAAMGGGGEIFVLDMGEPVGIVQLARDLIRLSGLPQDAIEINFSGIRPGEKLYEELYFDDEETLPTAHPKLRAAYHRPFSMDEVGDGIIRLVPAINDGPSAVRAILRELLPEFQSQTPLGGNGHALHTRHSAATVDSQRLHV